MNPIIFALRHPVTVMVGIAALVVVAVHGVSPTVWGCNRWPLKR
jgi:hypothetical protein